MKRTCSLTLFRTCVRDGAAPLPLAAMAERLDRHGFRSIDETNDEISTGWVRQDDHDASDLCEESIRRDHYLTFAIRQDRRRIPAAVLRRQCQEMERQWLCDHPGLNRVPKAAREEIRDAARGQLLGKTLPVPSVADAVWDMDTGRLILFSQAKGTMDAFDALFRLTFPEYRLEAEAPLERIRGFVLPVAVREALEKANGATGDGILERVEANRWIGAEFLQWLTWRTCESDGRYDDFVAYVANRVLLVGSGEAGVQKITAAGPQDRFQEVKSALASGKQVTKATVVIDEGDNQWQATLDADWLRPASFRTPPVLIDRDGDRDEKHEKEAFFYEKIFLLSRGMQLFDLLLCTFITQRLGLGWDETAQRIRQWAQEMP